jgi:hypothetical protein
VQRRSRRINRVAAGGKSRIVGAAAIIANLPTFAAGVI